jgi:Domain of unknown function (DUF4157)
VKAKAKTTSTSKAAEPAVTSATGLLQRKCGSCGNHTIAGGECKNCDEQKNLLQRKDSVGPFSESERSEVPAIVHEVLGSSGRPLDSSTRAFFEPRFAHNFSRVPVSSAARQMSASSLTIGEPSSIFEHEADRMADAVMRNGNIKNKTSPRGEQSSGLDLSRVRIHTGSRAAESARAVNAQAYTVGNNIIFGAGQFSPETQAGRHLIAHELTHTVQQKNSAGPSALYVQRNPLSAIGDFFASIGKGIARLFGSENYSKEELDAYLEKIKTTNQIEGNYDSDNKARAVVNRQTEFPPLDRAMKIQLIQEMLKGATLGADERAILQLLRTAEAAERKAIVTSIGSELLLDNFSGENFRSLEAITLTAADFSRPAIISRLKGLPRNELTEYKDQALDPDVKASIEKILAMQNISTPLGVDANFSKVGTATLPAGTATLMVKEIEVYILPDIYNAPVKEDMAFTETRLKPSSVENIMVDSQTKNIASFDPPKLRVEIQTRYSKSRAETESGKAGYGRGTTSEDISAGNTNLRFHEGQHGLDALEFFKRNDPPKFTGAVGMTSEQFDKAFDAYQKDINAYSAAEQLFSIQRSDCPGVPIGEQYLKQVGASTTICTDLKKKK